MKNLKIFAVLAILVVSIFSCKKSNDPAPTPEQLILGKWKIIAWKEVDGGVTIDSYAASPACEKDNSLEYRSDNVVIVDESASKCSPNDPQQIIGSWTISEGGRKLNHTGTIYGSAQWDISELTSTTLILKFNDVDYEETMTFQKI